MRLLCIILLSLSSLASAQEVSKYTGPDAGALARSFVIECARYNICTILADKVPLSEPPTTTDLIIQNRFFSIHKRTAAKFSLDLASYMVLHQCNGKRPGPACALALKQACFNRVQQQLIDGLAKLMPRKDDDPWYIKHPKKYGPLIIASSFIFVTDAYVVPKLLSLKQ